MYVSSTLTTYSLNDAITVNWETSFKPMGIWLTKTTPISLSNECWALIYSNGALTTYTTYLNKVRSSTYGNSLTEGTYTIFSCDENGNRRTVGNTIHVVADNSLGIILENGNTASTDINMNENDIRSLKTLRFRDGTSMTTASASLTLGQAMINGNTASTDINMNENDISSLKTLRFRDGTSMTTANGSTALNPINPQYTYPVSSPSFIGWTQVITITNQTFSNTSAAYCCNTTPLVAGIYIMRPYVYCGYSSWSEGYQYIFLVCSNIFITNASTEWINPGNATPMGYLDSRRPNNSGDSVHTVSFVVNNTGAAFYPYWAVAVLNQVPIFPVGNGVPQMNFVRIA